MQNSIEVRGKNTEDAITKALSALGMTRDEVSVEILERGRSGFLGIGAVEAVVRVTYEMQDEPVRPEPVQTPALEKQQPAPTQGNAPDESEAVKKTPAPQVEKNEQVEYAKTPKPEGVQAERTEAFLRGLLEHMGVHAEIEITASEGGGLHVELTGSGIGAVIGRRGETLDAIQHLTNYVVTRGSDKHAHITVDAEHYRAKREESLVHLAEKMAEKAIRYKRSMALEPMNSYERHVIHTALQNYEGVTTSSIGSEPNRRVVVSYVRPETEKTEETGYKEWC